MEVKLSAYSQDVETMRNYTFIIPSRESENSGDAEVITFSPTDNDRSDKIDPPSPAQPPDSPNQNP